jgi:type IV secretory pathway protease TraF
MMHARLPFMTKEVRLLDWLIERGIAIVTTGWRFRPWRGMVGVVVVAAYAAPALGYAPWPVYWNTGASMPKGLYLLQPGAAVERDAVVVLVDPPHFDLPWLMKRVEGVPGDLYCWDAALGTHLLNGRAMPPPDARAAAMGLLPWQGCRRLGPGEIVGYGRSRDSYDSRYLGPVATARLAGVYQLVLASEEQ